MVELASRQKIMATLDDRKKRIMEHLARSSGNFIKPTFSSETTAKMQRQQRILDHARRTRG